MSKVRIKSIIKLFVIILFFLVCLELITRKFYHPPELNDQYRWNAIFWLHQNVVLNSSGYRDVEHTLDNQNGNFRIYIVGNSYTFGWFVDHLEDTYPKIIEKKLNEINPQKKVEVINGAMWGFRIKQEVDRFAWEGKRYHPDLVLLGLVPYEGSVSNKYFRPADIFLPEFIRFSHFYYFLIGQYLQKWADKENYQYYLSIFKVKNSPELTKFENYIINLKKETEKLHAQFAILVFPYINEKNPNTAYDFYAYNNRIRALGEKYNIIIFDPIKEFERYPNKSQLILSPVDPHPTKQLNHLVANSFVEKFNLEDFLKNYKKYKQNILIKEITYQKDSIGDYKQILKVENKDSSARWIFFETSNQNSQEFSLNSISSRSSMIFPDRVLTYDNQEPELLYYTYSKDGETLSIPTNLYGYKILGINRINALSLVDGVTRPVIPKLITKDSNNYEITFKKSKSYYVFRLNLSISANQINVNKDGSLRSILTRSVLNKTQDIESFDISLFYDREIYSLNHYADNSNPLKTFLKQTLGLLESITNSGFFSLTDKSGKLKPFAKTIIGNKKKDYKTYVFIDGAQTRVKNFSFDNKKIILKMYKKIKKGQKIELPILGQYDFNKNGAINIEYEN